MARGVFRWLILGASITGIAAACGGSSDSGVGSGPVSYSQFPDAFGRAVCANLGSCCSNAGLPYDLATCEERAAAGYRSDAADAHLGPYDEEASGPCLTALATAARKCNIDAVIEPPGACAVFFNPPEVHAKAGEACSGTCTLEGTGETCGLVSYPLDGGGPSPGRCFTNDGVFCNYVTGNYVTGVCEPLPAVGEPCPPSGSCETDGWCNDNLVCEARFPEGGYCTDARQCASGLYCPAAFGGIICPPGGGQCTSTAGPPYCTKLRPDGAQCEEAVQCSSLSCNGVCGGVAPSGKLLSFVCVN